MSPHSTMSETRVKPEMDDEEMDNQSEVSWEESDHEDAAVKETKVETNGADVDMEDADHAETKETKLRATVKLENIFDDDEESSPALEGEEARNVEDNPAPLSPTAKEEIPMSSAFDDPDVMYAFYARLFPFRQFFHWLNHSATPTNDFTHRELAFTLQNGAYLRYQSFPTAEQMKAEVLKVNPTRFEIGPVYNTNPRDRKALRKGAMLKPLKKELVFDIDMTDYDDIRTCCSKAEICHKCWAFITMSVKVIDTALREDFGFEHILWVYSGRRGAHAWVCDKRARLMDDSRRKAIAGYLELVKGGSSGKRVNIKRPLHPHIARSLELLKPYFQGTILQDQDPWRSEEGADKLLTLIPDTQLREALRKKWEAAPDRSSTSKWSDIDALARSGASSSLDAKQLLEAKQDILLEYTYPRLDAEVSKKLNHLLKSPFVIHPGTGRVCVPICADGDLSAAEKFDPFSVPTVTQLLGQIDKYGHSNGGKEEGRKVADYEKTELKPYIEAFRRFTLGLMDGVVKGEDGMEF